MGGQGSPDRVAVDPATPEQLAAFGRVSETLSTLSTPRLVSEDGADRLFVAAFDGTGNSKLKDSAGEHTNVANIDSQISEHVARETARQGFSAIASGYVEGVGTQGGLSGLRDQGTGRTFDDRLEDMYYQFTRQAKSWIDQNPDADIRLAAVGFSRGAEQAARFTRMVEERGIRDPENAVIHRSSDGRIERVDYAGPPLREPGSVIQAAALFDPVGTGAPRDHDRRLASTVVTGLQITAEDERRNLFPVTRHMDPGITEDGRFYNALVPGAHSNVGGGYNLDGLSIRSGNLMVDYLNSLSDKPYLEKREEPTDPARNVIHRSEDHHFFYRTSEFDRAGQRAHQEDLAPANLCRMDCRDAMPRNEAMAADLTWRPVTIGPVPGAQSAPATEQSSMAPGSNTAAVERMLAAARDGNGQAIEAMTREQAQSERGQAWLQQGQAQLQLQEASVRDAAQRAQQDVAQPEMVR